MVLLDLATDHCHVPPLVIIIGGMVTNALNGYEYFIAIGSSTTSSTQSLMFWRIADSTFFGLLFNDMMLALFEVSKVCVKNEESIDE